MLARVMTLLALALAAGLIAAGCGDDDDETTTAATTTAGATGATGATGVGTGEPLSQDEFIAEADQICTDSDKKINAAGQDIGNKPSDQEFDQFVTETLVPEIQGQIDDIRALTPPEGDEDEVSAILDAAQDGVDQIEQDPSSVQGEDDPFQEANQLAKDYGFKKCG